MSGVQKGERKDTLESVFQHFSGLGQPPDPHGPGLWMEELGKNWASRHVLFHAHHPQPTKYQSGLRRRWKKENEKMNKRRAYPSWCKWRSPSKIHMDEENIWQLFEQSNQKKNKQTNQKRGEGVEREEMEKIHSIIGLPAPTSHVTLCATRPLITWVRASYALLRGSAPSTSYFSITQNRTKEKPIL